MSNQKITVSWDDISRKESSAQQSVCNRENFIYQNKEKQKNPLARIAIIIICCLFALAIGAFVLQPSYKKPISEVLNADNRIGQEAKNNSSPRQAILMMVNRMKSIDLSACPKDFSMAYQRHTAAWAKMLPLVEQAEQLNGWGNAAKSFILGLLSGYTGNFGLVIGNVLENANASDELKQQAENVEAEIKSSFEDVKECARKYGVDTSDF